MFDDATRTEQAQTIAVLFGQLKAIDHQIELGGRELLASAKAAGKVLLKIKAACPHGTFLATLDRLWPHGRNKASRYMRVEKNWHLVHQAADLATALQILAGPIDELEETKAPAPPNSSRRCFSHDLQPPQAKPEAATTPPTRTLGQTLSNSTSGAGGKAAELVRLKEALRKLAGVQERLSEVYADPDGRRVLKDVERHLPREARLHETGETYTISKVDGIEVVFAKVCSDHLADLLRLVASAVVKLKRELEG